jgi:hypothetical protein
MSDLTQVTQQQYYDNQLLEVADFNREQSFHIQHRQLQTQLLYTSGILQGLHLSSENTQLTLTPGVALNVDGLQLLLVDTLTYNDKNQALGNGVFSIDLGDLKNQDASYFLYLKAQSVSLENTKNQLISRPILTLNTSQTDTAGLLLGKMSVNSGQITVDAKVRNMATLRPQILPPIDANQITTGQYSIDQIPTLPASKVQPYASLSCDNPIVEGEGTVTFSWQSENIDQLTLCYISGKEIITQSSVDNTLALNGTKTISPWQNTVLTLTASKAGNLVFQQQLHINVIQTLNQYLKQLKEQGVPETTAIAQCANHYDLNKLTTKNTTTLATALKNTGIAPFKALDAVMSVYDKTDDLSPYVPVAKALGLFTPTLVTRYLVGLNQSKLLSAQRKMALPAYQKQVYLDIFTPVASHFASTDKNYWVYSLSSAMKQVGIEQTVTGYCLARYYKEKHWPESFKVSKILINAYS